MKKFELPESLKKFGAHVIETEEELAEYRKVDSNFCSDEEEEDTNQEEDCGTDEEEE